MKSTFQFVVLGIFVVAIIGGVVLLALYKGGGEQQGSGVPVVIWGTVPASQFTGLTGEVFKDIKGLSVSYFEKKVGDFDQDLLEALASGLGPDVILLSQGDILRYQDKLGVIPYTTTSSRNFKDTFISEAELFLGSAGVVAVPFSIDPLVLYWNRTIFANAGLSKTPSYWDELAALSEILTKKDQVLNISQSLIALGEYRNVNNAKAILAAMLLQAGNPIVASGSTGFESKFLSAGNSASNALNFYTEFANPVKPSYSWNRALPNARSYFLSGNLAVYLGFASEYRLLRDKNPNLDFDVAAFPQLRGASAISTYGNLTAFGILKASRNRADALNVISLLTNSKTIAKWVSLSALPPVRRDLLAVAPTDANQAVFYKAAVSARGWLDPNPEVSSQIFGDMIESITGGRLRTQEAIGQADRTLNAAVREVLPKQTF